MRIDRAGIAPPATCAQAADPGMARVLVKEGCVTVLRATYVDSTGTFVTTLGIAVMRSTAAGAAAEQLATGITAGLRAVSVPGTTASRFGDAQRQVFDLFPPGETPYIYLAAGGFTDGRIRTSGVAEPALSDLDSNILDDLMTIMTQHENACQEKDIRC